MRHHLTTATEIGMLAYWGLATALVLGWISIPPDLMYSDYENPLIVAWNWSFLPVDVAFATLGLWARFGGVHSTLALKLSLIAATLMFCAGLMAISFWSITGDFDPVWWGMNLWLVILSLTSLKYLLTAQTAN